MNCTELMPAAIREKPMVYQGSCFAGEEKIFGLRLAFISSRPETHRQQQGQVARQDGRINRLESAHIPRK
jgi:hypothetical protein